MPRLGLGWGLGGVQVLGAGLDFSALTALPVGRQSAVTTAANAAAATLGVTAQSIIHAIGSGRGLYSGLPNDGCNLVSSGGAVAVQGDPVGAIQSWTGVELATQTNASLKPVSAAPGLYANGTRVLLLQGISAWTAAEAITLFTHDWIDDNIDNLNRDGYWCLGSSISGSRMPLASTNAIFDSAFTNTRTSNVGGTVGNVCYQVSHTGTNFTRTWNDSIVANNVAGAFANSAFPMLLATNGGSSTASGFFLGWSKAIALNSALYSVAQRAAVREFCRSYFGF